MRILGLVGACCLVASGCQAGGDAPVKTVTVTNKVTVPAAPTPPTTPPIPQPAPSTPVRRAATKTCTSQQAGFSVRYPRGWHANRTDQGAACSMFHPRPFEVQAGTDDVPAVLVLQLRDERFAVATAGRRIDDQFETVDFAHDDRIAGRRALIVQRVATGEGLYPAGYRTYEVYVAIGQRTLAGQAFGRPDVSFPSAKVVLNGIVGSFELA